MFAAFLVARGVFGLVFLVSALTGSAVPWYLPLAHAWTFTAHPTAFGMDWFGRTAMALVASALFGGATWLVASRAAWLGRREVVLAIAHAGAMILVVDFLYFGWTLTHVPATPLPLPGLVLPALAAAERRDRRTLPHRSSTIPRRSPYGVSTGASSDAAPASTARW